MVVTIGTFDERIVGDCSDVTNGFSDVSGDVGGLCDDVISAVEWLGGSSWVVDPVWSC